ncbi:hypothetical protein AN958_06343 [Leucoagaricus sp. SymC.cos]|nr:hypothetical protein AN958_06343 [Leucoagaricus sp. SymC.cos]
MPRPPKVTPSRSTPRLSTRSQHQSPPRSKVYVNAVKNQGSITSGPRGETSDNDNDSVCSSSKSSDVAAARSSLVKGKGKDEPGAIKAPWRHPDELDYFRPHDWSEDKIISQLRAMVFMVPPPVNGKQSFIEITFFDDGDFDKPRPIKVPRGYRVPLMFVAKFQWASLKLVLTSAQREKEWSDYKFDILHLSRLCERFFSEAQTACKAGIVEIPPMKMRAAEFQVTDGAMSRKWRCPTFDRALARYNKNWLISREEFLRDFYIEFEDEEYAKDVLKTATYLVDGTLINAIIGFVSDWSRWALKGHKGFKLAQDELKTGIDARMITRGLKKNANGKWVWVDDYVIKQEEVATVTLLPPGEVTAPSPSSPIAERGPQSIPSPKPTDQPDPSQAEESAPASEPSPASAAPPKELPSTVSSLTPPPSPSRQTSSDVLSIHTAKQPSPFVEKVRDHCSLPSSASPSEFPPNQSEVAIENAAPVPPESPTPRSRRPSTDNIIQNVEPLPPLVIPSSQDSIEETRHPTPPPSEGTQPLYSRSSPPPSGSEEPAQNASATGGTSPLTPINVDVALSENGRDSIFLQEAEEVKPIIVPINHRQTPTSIDSTPNPSPAILPKDAEESKQNEDVPEIPGITSTNRLSNALQGSEDKSKNDIPPGTAPPDPVTPTKDLEPPDLEPPSVPPQSPPGTPYGPPRPPPRETAKTLERASECTFLVDRSDVAVAATSPCQPPKMRTKTRGRTPVFLSPLLPPASRSRSPSLDEIPGLGGLSTHRKINFHPQFVTPKMTARTVTDGSSWSITENNVGQVKPMKVEPQEPDLSLLRGDDGNQNERNDVVKDVRMRSPERSTSPRVTESTSTNAVDLQYPETRSSPFRTLSPPPFTPQPVTQNQQGSQPPVSDVDDDSDMDFGTPVTSPVIIVPGPKLEPIDMLPPPMSPTTSPVAAEAMKIAVQREHPPSPLTATPIQVAHPTGAPAAVTPKAQQPRAPSTTPKQLLPPKTPVPPTSALTTDSQMRSHPQVMSTPLALAITHFPPPAPPAAPVQASTSFTYVPPTPTPLSYQPTLTAPPTVPLQPTLSTSTNNQCLSKQTSATSLSYNEPLPPPPSPPIRQPGGMQILETGPSTTGSSNVVPPAPIQSLAQPQSQSQFQPITPSASFSHVPSESTPRHEQHPDIAAFSPMRPLFNSRAPRNASHSQIRRSGSTGLSRKRHRDDEDDYEDEEIAFKSRKRGEGLSIREGGIVVRKVVSMVRDTLTAGSRGVDSSDVTQLSEELKLMKAEMAQLKEKQTTREAPPENDHVLAMRAELEALREQIRIIKETQPSSEPPEVQMLRDELASLKNEMRSLQDISHRSSLPSTPPTPNLTLRFNSHTMANTIHPLAHLLAVEPDASSLPALAGASSQPTPPQPVSQIHQSGSSQPSTSLPGGEPEKRPNVTAAPHPPVLFDHISLPVKSKRKARTIFARS